MRCECEAPPGQGLGGAHDTLEVVRVDGRDYVRRSEARACPVFLAAVLRARAFSEQPERLATLQTPTRDASGEEEDDDDRRGEPA